MRKHLMRVLKGIVLIVSLVTLTACMRAAENKEESSSSQIESVSSSQVPEESKEYPKEKTEFQVSFLSSDGTILSTSIVKRGEDAVPPATNQMPAGYVFSHWDTEYTNVQQDMEIRAVCIELP